MAKICNARSRSWTIKPAPGSSLGTMIGHHPTTESFYAYLTIDGKPSALTAHHICAVNESMREACKVVFSITSRELGVEAGDCVVKTPYYKEIWISYPEEIVWHLSIRLEISRSIDNA